MAAEPKGGKVTRKADGTTVLPDGSAFCTMTVPSKKACTPVAVWNARTKQMQDDTFATDYMKTAGLSDLLSPRVWQAAGRRAFNEGSQAPPTATAVAGGVIGSALGGAADLAASAVNPSHSIGFGPAVGAGLGATPGLVHGALRMPGQLAGLSRHLGAQR